MRKLKRTCKKAKGLKVRLKREEFLDQLKNPAKYATIRNAEANEILKKIRNRNKPNPDGTMARIRRMAGLE